jgi:hypothetical protein
MVSSFGKSVAAQMIETPVPRRASDLVIPRLAGLRSRKYHSRPPSASAADRALPSVTTSRPGGRPLVPR